VLSENRIANNTYGVSFYSSNNVFRKNRFDNNEYSIADYSNGANDIDTSNAIDGKPIYYWVNQHDRTVPGDAGFVVLKNCSGITVQNLNLANNGHDVLLYYTNDSTVSGNILTNNLKGIALQGSSGNVISGNQITNNKGYGISLEYGSNNNVLSQNEIVANAEDGVNFESSVSSTVVENYVAENDGNGIFFRSIQDSNVIGNNVTLNKGCGIGFGYGPNGTIRENIISRNGVGIWISNAVENTITRNTIAENDGWGIRLEGSQKNNVIHHNNFINNSLTEPLQASILKVWIYPGLNKHFRPGEQPEPPKFVAGAANIWDDGREGNYWSDYTSRYPDAAEVGITGVGDIPYFINENNLDRHPLMVPFDISSASVSEWGSPETQQSEPIPTTLVVAPIASVAVIGVVFWYTSKNVTIKHFKETNCDKHFQLHFSTRYSLFRSKPS
jgi:parallel beta-helix repeat protein